MNIKKTEARTRTRQLRPGEHLRLKHPESFKAFLEEFEQDQVRPKARIKKPQALTGIAQFMMEEYLRDLRNKRYFLWLKEAESFMYLNEDAAFLKSRVLQLMMGLDYKKFYDVLLFEFHHYITRACFCKLALHYKVNLNQRVLRYELSTLIHHLKGMLKENCGFAEQTDFKAIFTHAYRDALMDLYLYHSLKINVLSEPLFSFNGLLNRNLKVIRT